MMPFLLHHLPDMLLASLASWLGLSLLVRAPRDTATRAFAGFAGGLALYGLSGLLPEFTTSAAVAAVLHRFHLLSTVVLPTLFLHFILLLVAQRPPRWQWVLLTLFYGLSAAMGLYALLGPLPAPTEPFPSWARWGEPRFPTGLLEIGWDIARIVPVLVALLVMALAYRLPPRDGHERRLRRHLILANIVGVSGSLFATIGRDMAISTALPRTFILFGLILLSYTVLVHRVMLPRRVARRTFYYSILGGLITTGYVTLVLTLDYLVQVGLAIDVPLVSVLSLVGVIALLEPLRAWFREKIDRYFYQREFHYVTLARSLTTELHQQGDLSDQLEAALAGICRALGAQIGLIALQTESGLAIRAGYGPLDTLPDLRAAPVPADTQSWVEDWQPWPQARILIPLRQADQVLGLVALAQQRAPQPFSASERALIDYLHSYLVLAVSHAHARAKQEAALEQISRQSEALREQQAYLEQKAAQAEQDKPSPSADTPPAHPHALQVYALGALLVEQAGTPITRWGGTKAGTYQAEALFAFLFDRQGKGVSKDEVAEVIWPDLAIDKADNAFHRTLAALRRTLEPGLRRGNQSAAILYHHERYWLEPTFVTWSDTDAFREAAERGLTLAHQGDMHAALPHLQHAHDLYRGDYMDDCPFYGDSAAVEEQRTPLRARYIDVELALGAAHEALGQAGEATSAYRRALLLSPDGCPPAAQGLERLQAAPSQI